MADGVRVQQLRRIAQALSALACLAAMCGAGLLFLWARAPETPVSAIETEPRRAEVIPSTVPPRLVPSTVESTTTSTPSTTTTAAPPASPTPAPSRSTVATSPPSTGLADLLPPIERGAALPTVRAPRPAPIGMEISTFDTTSFPIRPVGIEDDGQLEVPDETEIGWYRYGATAGAPGTTVLAAHVSWNDTVGPFFELGTLDPGAQVSVTLDDGTTRWYEVTERARYDKDELPRDRIWRNTGPETLVLITCGGDFNPEIRRYRHNIVVYAVPVG